MTGSDDPPAVTDDPLLKRSLTDQEAKAYSRVKLYASMERLLLAVVAMIQSALIVFLAST